jgi:hypothetical protein
MNRWLFLTIIGIKHMIQKDEGFLMEWIHAPRPMCKYLNGNYNDKKLTIAEIGVGQGYHALSMLKTLNISRLWLVDPYVDHPHQYVEAQKILKKYQDRTRFIKDFSVNGAEYFSDGFLDAIYIDAEHTYNAVRDDINAWYPKVKMGGVIGGHDFDGDFTGVLKAVFEFSFENNVGVNSRRRDWWMVKK